MSRFIVLLRAVNVGGTGKLPMKELRDTLIEADFENVQTLLASGNAILEAREKSPAKLEDRIEELLKDAHGLDTSVMVRTAKDWDALIANNPMPDEAARAPSTFITYAMKDRTAKSRAIAKTYIDNWDGAERSVVTKEAVYVFYPDGSARTKFDPKKFGVATGRNWNTVLKLQKLVNS